MNPIISLEYYNKEYINNYEGIIAWLLYSEADKNFAKYVREAWDALDEFSGRHCLITLIDKKDDSSNEYWQNLGISRENSKMIYESLTGQNLIRHLGGISDWFLQFKPYNRNVHIKIANQLNIPYSAMPCLVFYTSTTSKEYIVYSFSNEWTFEHLTEHMQAIFTSVRENTLTIWQYNATKEEKRKIILTHLEKDFTTIKIKKFVKRIITRITIGDIISTIK